MKEQDKRMCEVLFKDCNIINKDEFMCDNINVECYSVEYLGHEYTLTKHNGEWVYFHRNN